MHTRRRPSHTRKTPLGSLSRPIHALFSVILTRSHLSISHASTLDKDEGRHSLHQTTRHSKTGKPSHDREGDRSPSIAPHVLHSQASSLSSSHSARGTPTHDPGSSQQTSKLSPYPIRASPKASFKVHYSLVLKIAADTGHLSTQTASVRLSSRCISTGSAQARSLKASALSP